MLRCSHQWRCVYNRSRQLVGYGRDTFLYLQQKAVISTPTGSLFGDNKFVINSDRLDEFLAAVGGIEYIEADVKDSPNDKVIYRSDDWSQGSTLLSLYF